MKGKSITGERDREATEKRLLDAIGKMIAEDGFEKIGGTLSKSRRSKCI